MRLKLHWVDVNTGLERTPSLETPIAFGREFGSMPSTIIGQSVSRMVLPSDQVEAYHALLTEEQFGQLLISDRGSRVCTQVNGVALPNMPVGDGDQITIGPFEIRVTVLPEGAGLTDAEAVDNDGAVAAARPYPSGANGVSSSSQEAIMGMNATGRLGTSVDGGVGNTAGNGSAGFGSDGRCDRKVGFLFKRRCERTTSEGCPDCRNGQIASNRSRYEDDYAYYPDYGRYGRGYWGSGYYYNRHRYYYDPSTRNVDFNESDAASFEQEGDQDFEMDLDAS